MTWMLLLLAVLFQTGSLVLAKKAALDMSAFSFRAVATNWYYVATLGCLALQAVCWQLTLTRVPLSHAYGAMAVVYVAVLPISRFVFQETVSRGHLTGAVLITAGVILMTSRLEQRAAS